MISLFQKLSSPLGMLYIDRYTLTDVSVKYDFHLRLKYYIKPKENIMQKCGL